MSLSSTLFYYEARCVQVCGRSFHATASWDPDANRATLDSQQCPGCGNDCFDTWGDAFTDPDDVPVAIGE